MREKERTGTRIKHHSTNSKTRSPKPSPSKAGRNKTTSQETPQPPRKPKESSISPTNEPKANPSHCFSNFHRLSRNHILFAFRSPTPMERSPHAKHTQRQPKPNPLHQNLLLSPHAWPQLAITPEQHQIETPPLL